MSLEKEIDKKRSIGDVAREIGVETHVIRFWESKFKQVKPVVGNGGRRYYFDKNVAILKKIKSYLYDDGYTISGLQKLFSKNKNHNFQEQKLQFLQDLQEGESGAEAEEYEQVSPMANTMADIGLKKDATGQIIDLISNINITLDQFEKSLQNIDDE